MIKNNPLLYSIKGIGQAELGWSVNIEDNPMLSICNVRSVCDFVAKYNEDRFIVSGNAPGCNTYDEVSDVCLNGGFYETNVLSLYEELPHWSQLDISFNLPNIGYTRDIEYSSEFVLCGERYSKVSFPESEQRAYVRSDHQKAHFRRTENCSEKEYLLYDFSLNIGDTAWVGWGHYDWLAKDTAAFVVNNIDEFQQYGKIRKKLTLEYAEDDGAYTGKLHWVEGIGCLEHPFYPFAKMDDVLLHKYELLCYDSANVQFYQTPNYNSCSVNYIAVDELEKIDWEIAPNPFQNQIRISNEEVEILDIHMFTITGKEIPLTWTRNMLFTQIQLLTRDFYGLCLLQLITAQETKKIKLLRLSDFTD